jgi:hypothetical protein
VAVFSALLAFALNKISVLVRAVLGWSVTALFGRLSPRQQTALAVMLIASLLWLVAVIGIFAPALAAWAIAFVPLQKWTGAAPIRIVCAAVALLVPPVVGLITRRLASVRRQKGGALRAAILGYPLTLGYAASCVMTAIVVPIVKIGSAARRWGEDHAYVQPLEGHYGAALEELTHACRDADVTVHVEEVPARLSLPTRALKWLARGAIDPLVAENPRMLRAPNLELYLYPADLLLRGDKAVVARVRACMTRTLLERHAYMVASDRAQRIADEIRAIWASLDGGATYDDPRDRSRWRIAEIARELDTTNLPFDEWLVLDRWLDRLQLEVGGGTRFPLPESDTRVRDDQHRHHAQRVQWH